MNWGGVLAPGGDAVRAVDSHLVVRHRDREPHDAKRRTLPLNFGFRVYAPQPEPRRKHSRVLVRGKAGRIFAHRQVAGRLPPRELPGRRDSVRFVNG
jgi:hypothetical protein